MKSLAKLKSGSKIKSCKDDTLNNATPIPRIIKPQLSNATNQYLQQMIRKIALLTLGILMLLMSGIKMEPEFSEPAFFIKPRPTFKLVYYTVLGNIDMTINDLKGKRLEHELAWEEIVGSFYGHNVNDAIAPFFIILATLLFTTGLWGLILKTNTVRPRVCIIDSVAVLLFFFGSFVLYWNQFYSGQLAIILFFAVSLATGVFTRKILNGNTAQ
jgi:hypothetical protein